LFAKASRSQRPIRGQLADEPIRQRLNGVVLILLRLGLTTDRDDRALDIRRGQFVAFARTAVGLSLAIAANADGRLVFRPDVAAIDRKPAIRVDADEHAGAADLSRIIADRTVLEGGERRFDFAETSIDFVRQLIGVLVFGLELGVLGVQHVDRRLFLDSEIRRRAFEFAQMVGVAEREIDIDLDPLPALGGDLLRFGFQLFCDHAVEEADILQPAAVILLEEIAQDDTARLLIGFEADEQGALVRRARGAFRQQPADLIRLLAVGALKRLPDLLLTRVIVRHGERHELFERHTVLGIDVEQLVGDSGEPQPLFHHVHPDEERGGDLFLGLAVLAQCLEGAELIERMERSAMDVLSQ
jgi:hypothetical protein